MKPGLIVLSNQILLFISGIKPILPLPIKGALWYQGESNAQELERVDEYGQLVQLMVNDYRKK